MKLLNALCIVPLVISTSTEPISLATTGIQNALNVLNRDLTTDIYTYGGAHTTNYVGDIDMTGKTHVEFKVKAAHDAHVLLTSDNGSVFEIVIGGWSNSKSKIRSSSQVDSSSLIEKNGVALDRDNFIYFKISWAGDDLVVERASGDDYLEWMTLSHWRNVGNKNTIDKIDVSTGWGSSGDWVIYHQKSITRCKVKDSTSFSKLTFKFYTLYF